MKTGKDQKQKRVIVAASIGIAFVLIAIVAFALNILMHDDGRKRQKQIQMVTLLTPPPPPKIQEKPPEPEVKKEEIEEQEIEEAEAEEAEETPSDEPAAGNNLGLDADGVSGSDSFGLVANKGGRKLIGGTGGDDSIMRRYAWYTRILQEDLRKRVNEYLEENGGVPDSDAKAVVQIELDDAGKILNYSLKGSSGDEIVDKAIRESLKVAKISEPPPAGMPRTLKLRISARG